jgi:anti-sigma factor RsiW
MNDRAYLDDERLQEYLDGRMNPDEAALVTAYLVANPERAAELERARHLDALLVGVGAEVLEEPIPERLLQIVRQGVSPPTEQQPAPEQLVATVREVAVAEVRAAHRRVGQRFAMAAMAAGLFLGGTLVGWQGYQFSNPLPGFDEMALSDAARAYALYGVEQNYPVEFGPDRLTDLSAWVGRTFKRTIDPPDVSAMGYQFVGGRILPGLQGSSCMYLFQNDAGQRVALVFWGRGEKSTLSATMPGSLPGLQSLSWNSDDLGYALLGEEGISGLDELTDAIKSFYHGSPSPTEPADPASVPSAKQAQVNSAAPRPSIPGVAARFA